MRSKITVIMTLLLIGCADTASPKPQECPLRKANIHGLPISCQLIHKDTATMEISTLHSSVYIADDIALSAMGDHLLSVGYICIKPEGKINWYSLGPPEEASRLAIIIHRERIAGTPLGRMDYDFKKHKNSYFLLIVDIRMKEPSVNETSSGGATQNRFIGRLRGRRRCHARRTDRPASTR